MSIELQNNEELPLPVSEKMVLHWMEHALTKLEIEGEICVCIVNEAIIASLNGQYRSQYKRTNVLSFPSELPEDIKVELSLLGDIVICPQVLENEAVSLNKPLRDHWAHICVHGVLHLLGYDHIKKEDETRMQAQEINILTDLNIPNPYSESEGACIEQ